jgi:hypothetical protein
MRSFAIAFTIALLTACGSSEAPPAAPEAPAEGTPAEGTAAPAEGAAPAGDAAAQAAATTGAGPTAAKLTEANGAVVALNPWTDSAKKLNELLGAPMKQAGSDYMWWAKDGEGCKVLRVQQNGDMVGSVTLTAEPSCPQ